MDLTGEREIEAALRANRHRFAERDREWVDGWLADQNRDDEDTPARLAEAYHSGVTKMDPEELGIHIQWLRVGQPAERAAWGLALAATYGARCRKRRAAGHPGVLEGVWAGWFAQFARIDGVLADQPPLQPLASFLRQLRGTSCISS
jgi:hypothetical protein